jgi:hypothetical protein
MMEKHIAVSLILAALVGGITASGWADDRVISPDIAIIQHARRPATVANTGGAATAEGWW